MTKKAEKESVSIRKAPAMGAGAFLF